MASSYQFLTVERHGGVERVTLNRPDVRNAFNEHVIADLTAWARNAHADPPRVVVFAGAGKVFSAGADAAWMAKMAGYSRDDNMRHEATHVRNATVWQDFVLALGVFAGTTAVVLAIALYTHYVTGALAVLTTAILAWHGGFRPALIATALNEIGRAHV